MDNNWDDKTQEIHSQIIDLPKREDRDFCILEENKTTERFRVRYFVNGHQVGAPMYAFDGEGAMALVRLMLGDRANLYRKVG